MWLYGYRPVCVCVSLERLLFSLWYISGYCSDWFRLIFVVFFLLLLLFGTSFVCIIFFLGFFMSSWRFKKTLYMGTFVHFAILVLYGVHIFSLCYSPMSANADFVCRIPYFIQVAMCALDVWRINTVNAFSFSACFLIFWNSVSYFLVHCVHLCSHCQKMKEKKNEFSPNKHAEWQQILKCALHIIYNTEEWNIVGKKE